MINIESVHRNDIDLTNYNFSKAPFYKTIPISYRAIQLKKAETIIRSWAIQEMKKGDWIVLKQGPDGNVKRSGVKNKAFEATYISDPENIVFYIKDSYIKAVKIDHPYKFLGIDSDVLEQAPLGTYLVLNLDKNKRPIIVQGRRDIFFYKEKDIQERYQLI